MSDKAVSQELASLAEVAREVAALRAEVEKLRAERAAHHCHGCSYMPYLTVTSGGTGTNISTSSIVTTTTAN